MEERKMMNTKEVAGFLDLNEKMIYSLINEKGLPGTKITGKWLFSRPLVEQWLENNTINHPGQDVSRRKEKGLLIIAGSNDILLEKAIHLFNAKYPEYMAVFGNLGSMGGIRALREKRCHIAPSHLLQKDADEYNFDFAEEELDRTPALVNFCFREQGLLVQKNNPKGIHGVEDFLNEGVRIVNRAESTGTRLLLDMKIVEAGIDPAGISGFDHVAARHLDVGLEILGGHADAGPGIRAVAGILGLDFIPWKWERFDLLISRERFFDKGVQLFLGMLHEPHFRDFAEKMDGYDLRMCGKMMFPMEKNGQSEAGN